MLSSDNRPGLRRPKAACAGRIPHPGSPPARTLILATLLLSAAAAASPAGDLVRAGHFKRARALVLERLRTHPADAEAHSLMAQIRMAFGDLDGAVSHGEKAVALETRNADYRNVLGQVYGRQAQRTSMLRAFGLARKCRREAEAALAIDPNHFEANVMLATFLAQAPAVIGGDKARAAELVEQVAKRNPADAWFVRAHMAEESGQHDKLEELYRKGLEIAPRNIEARIAYGSVLLNKKPPPLDRIEKNAREILQLDPGRAAPYSQLALCRIARGDWDELEAVLREAARNVPDDPSPHYWTARALLTRNQEIARAEASIRLYLAQEPEGKAPDHAAAQWTLGLLLEKLGRKSEAIAALEKSLALRRGFEPARKDLKRLKG